jgi:hypothetical protein
MAVCVEYKIPHSEFLGWDSDDRAKAIWWHVRERERCPSCGTRHEDWVDDPHAYVGELVRCRGCEVRQQTESSVTESDGRGIHVVLKRRRES